MKLGLKTISLVCELDMFQEEDIVDDEDISDTENTAVPACELWLSHFWMSIACLLKTRTDFSFGFEK